jgi:hypothetical protein
VIILQRSETKLTLGQSAKLLLDATGSLGNFNWHHWGKIIVTVHGSTCWQVVTLGMSNEDAEQERSSDMRWYEVGSHLNFVLLRRGY